jgi:hypothetical protein
LLSVLPRARHTLQGTLDGRAKFSTIEQTHQSGAAA